MAIDSAWAATGRPLDMPDRAWRIPDRLTVCERLRGLQALAAEGARTPEVRAEATTLHAQADAIARRSRVTRGADRARLLAQLVLERAQATGYAPDPAGEDWWQPVTYTMRHAGDCEDLSARLLALAWSLGLQGCLVWIDQPGKPLNHVAPVLWIGGAWQWAEPSVPGAQLGESPYVAAARLMDFRALPPDAVAPRGPQPPTAPRVSAMVLLDGQWREADAPVQWAPREAPPAAPHVPRGVRPLASGIRVVGAWR